MTRELQREFLRQNHIDIEITVVSDIKDGKTFHTGQYRYLVSHWAEDGTIVKNYYNDEKFDSYVEAEDKALQIAYKILDIYKSIYPNDVDQI